MSRAPNPALERVTFVSAFVPSEIRHVFPAPVRAGTYAFAQSQPRGGVSLPPIFRVAASYPPNSPLAHGKHRSGRAAQAGA
jgi:hypothetical protein